MNTQIVGPVPDAFRAPLQSDRKKEPDSFLFRPFTEEEVKALRCGQYRTVRLNNGRIGQVKINGAVKVWKLNPKRVRVSIKYGMYEHAQWGLEECLSRFVMPLGG